MGLCDGEMKVIKRDGRAVDYDRQKIVIAIEKANQEVRKVERATKEDIKKIIEYIEDLGKKRILVEDVQDIIEQKLMEFQKFELAKKYIVYRYTRALVRKPRLLILDEPATGLDYNITKELYKILANENKENNMTIIMVTHDLDELEEIKPRIITLAKTVKYDGAFEGWGGF